MALHEVRPYQIPLKSVNKYVKYGYKLIYTHKHGMTVTEPIFMKLKLSSQIL
jgi:hypothetical protein